MAAVPSRESLMDADSEQGSFGPVLRRLRLEARMTQEELAERARLSVESISALERGTRRNPYRETIRMLGNALGLSDTERRELHASVKRPRPPSAKESASHPDAQPAVPGGPVPIAGSRHNLPLSRTSLIGRETAIAEVAGALEDGQLVTVIGPGGIGKTKVAISAGDRALEWAEVRLVDLAPLTRESAVAPAIMQALGVQPSPNRSLLPTLLARLKERRLLLILDNCEHVIAEAAALTDALLAGCPRLRILVTSREPLRIAGERTYRLPPLLFPPQHEARGLTACDAAKYPALMLFAARAREIDVGFALGDDTAPVVAEICRRLDGIPLAIEMAASRVKLLGPRQLRDRLDERFRMLTGGSRDASPRQQSLQALIDWSHELLNEQERVLFRRLAIFAGGFTLEAAVAVGGGDDLDAIDVLDVLAALVDKSLVLADHNGEALLYRFLESTRLYAREKLQAAGERDRCARRLLQSESPDFVTK
jgi:predicted ATPase/transcriptional regulator with XRE-family HTH domain